MSLPIVHEATCEPLSYDVCKDFVVQFDRLYNYSDYGDGTDNPMRKDSSISLHDQDTTTIFDDVQFPIEYWFTSDGSTGITDRTDSAFTQSKGVQGNFALVNPNTGLVRF